MTYVAPSTARHPEVVVAPRPVVRPTDAGLLVLRGVVGAVFLMHGWQKVFQLGVPQVTGFFAQAGIPLPEVAAPVVAWLELAGGALLVLGVLTRLVALLFAVQMVGAIWFVHLPAGFFLPNGYEFALTLLGASLALVLIGPGFISVDGAVARRKLRAPVVVPRDEATITTP